jgi:subtilisin-like proprotein convertase family protein
VRLHGAVLASINATLGAGLDVFQVIDSVVLGKTLIKAGSGDGDNQVQIQDAILMHGMQVKSPAKTQLTVIDSQVNGLAKLTLGTGSEMEITGRPGGAATQFNDRFFANLGSNSVVHLGPNLNFAAAVSFKGKGPFLPGIGAVGISAPGNPKIKDIVFVVRQTSPSSDVPKPIPLVGTVTSILNVGQPGLIVDVNVSLNLTHTWDEDLDIVLISPTGTHVLLTSDNGGDSDNYTDTVFNDEAIQGVNAGQAPFASTFSPEGLLPMRDLETAAGIWTLVITDDTSGDSGTLLGWSLTITSNSLVPPV